MSVPPPPPPSSLKSAPPPPLPSQLASAAAKLNVTSPTAVTLRPTGNNIRSPKSPLVLDEATLENQMKALSSNTRNVRTAKKLGRNKETIHTLLDALRTKPKFTKMVEYSLECLKNLAVDEVSVEEMLDEGTLDAIINVMKLNPYNEKIQHMVNKTIAAFCLNSRLADMIASKLGGSGMVFSLKKHVEPETLESTCAASYKLMCSEQHVANFVTAGVVPALQHVMHTQEESVEVLTQATKCLERIAGISIHCGAIMDSGVCSDVLNALTHYPDNAALVSAALSLIARLASANPAFLARLKELGAVDVLVAALEHHGDNEALNRLGAAALRLLSGQGDIAAALSTEKGNTIEIANAVSKLASLLLVDENVEYFLANGGLEWLISVLQQALPEFTEIAAKILTAGCRALKRIAIDENKIYKIMQLGGVKLLMSIIDTHVKNDSIINSALPAVTQMITRVENAKYICQSGALASSLNCLIVHPSDATVTRHVLEEWLRTSAHAECVPLLLQAQILPALANIMKTYADNAELMEIATKIIGRMQISADNVAKFVEAGFIPLITALFTPHATNASLCATSLLLLENVALVPAHVEALRQAGVTSVILTCLENHPTNTDIQNIGARTLGLMSGDNQIKTAVDTVQTLSDQCHKNPSSIASIIDKLLNASRMVTKYARLDENLAALSNSGAVRALINCFNAGAKMAPSDNKSALLASNAAGLLRLINSPELTASIVKDGTLKAMFVAALAEPSNEELATAVSNLALLASLHLPNHPKLLSDACIEDLIALAKAHPYNEQVLAYVTKALSELATTPQLCRQIALTGGAEAVIESIYTNIQDKDFVLQAFQLLNKLAVDPECIRAIIAAGGIDAILEVMRTHPSDIDILTSCCTLLCKFLIDEEVAIQIGSKGGLPLCIKAMRQHYQAEKLCEIDMILLDSLATVNDNAQQLLDSELATIELVEWVGDSYKGNEHLSAAKDRLLQSLRALLAPPVSALSSLSLSLSDSMDPAALAKLLDCIRTSQGGDKAEFLRMLQQLLESLKDPKRVAELLENGGLQALAEFMLKHADDSELFYAAAGVFTALTAQGGEKIGEKLESPSLIQCLCSMINSHQVYPTPMNLSDLSEAVGATAKIKFKPAIVEELMKHQPLQSLLQMMVSSDDPILLSQAARLLGKLSNNNEAALLISKIANLRELIQAIRRNMKNEEFLKYAVYLLANLALNDELKTQIGIEGGIQAILAIMEAYPYHESLIENCCFALAELSFNHPINVSFIVACKGVQIGFDVIHNHPNATDTLDHIVSVMCNLAHNNNNNKDIILKASGAQAIVDVILNNFNTLELLHTCFRAIGNLAYDSKSVAVIVQAGGVQGLVAGMTVHTEDMEIIDISIRVLGNIANEANAESMATMAKEGAVQAITNSAIQYTSNLEIETSALNCLCNLGRQVSNSTMIIKQGGTQATIEAMKKLDFDAQLMSTSVRLLHILSHALPAELDRMHEANVVPALVEALKKQHSNRPLISHAMQALSKLAYNKDKAQKMGEVGTLQVILKIVQENIQVPQILNDCFPCLSSLARSEGNAVSMSELAMTSLNIVIQNPKSDARLLCIAFGLLANLCVHSQAAEAVLRTTLVTDTCEVFHRYVGQPDVLIRGLRALENMCFSTTEVKDHLRSNDLVDNINRVSNDNAAIDDVKRQCKAVLDALNRADFNYESGPLKSFMMKDVEVKSAKAIFGDSDTKNEVVEIPIEIRELLVAGTLMLKHSKTAVPRSRQIYVTPDFHWLVWRDPKNPTHHPENMMKISRIQRVEEGRNTEQLQRKRFGKYLADPDDKGLLFSIWGRVGDDQVARSIDLEAKSPAERKTWVKAFEIVINYSKHLKKLRRQFA